jgi:hypothetical protein
MGTQNKWERMPLPPANIPPHVVPLWRERAKIMAADYRRARDIAGNLTGSQLTDALNVLRLEFDRLKSPGNRYRALVFYRMALHEAVVSRHWTVTWSALTNQHEIR